MRLQPDLTPFAPNCSEGAPVRKGSDPVGLSLERLIAECPRVRFHGEGAGPLLKPHERGTLTHQRVASGPVCWESEDLRGRAFRPTDAQRDYWSRRGE